MGLTVSNRKKLKCFALFAFFVFFVAKITIALGGVTRTFATVDAALAYLKGAFLAEPSEGQLKFDDVNVFGAKSVVTQRVAALVGCTVAVNYSITG